jgi:hypothetical protein
MDCSYVRQLRRFVLRVSQAPDQNRVTCFVISALACTRARPAATLALLSHMLMNGFFFSHGLATGALPAEIFEGKRFSGANGLNQTHTTGDSTRARQVADGARSAITAIVRLPTGAMTDNVLAPWNGLAG